MKMSELVFDEKIVDIVQIKAFCKNCGRELKRGNERLLSNPPKYEYYCLKCNKKFISTQECPRIDYKPKEAEWEERIVEDENPYFRRLFYCTGCGGCTTNGKTKYCPDCGARMKV